MMTSSDITEWIMLGAFEITAVLLALSIIYQNVKDKVTNVFLYVIPLILILVSGVLGFMVQLFETLDLTCAMIGIETEMDKDTISLLFLGLGFTDCCAALWYYGHFAPKSNDFQYRDKRERRQILYKLMGLILLNAGWLYLFKNLFFITLREVYGIIHTIF